MSPNLTRLIVYKTLGMLVCIVPVTVAILSYFPLWLGGGGTEVLSGLAILLCTLAHAPLLRGLKRIFNSSASWAMWLVLFIAFLLLSEIAEQMTVISLVGFITNAIGAVLLKIGEEYREKKE